MKTALPLFAFALLLYSCNPKSGTSSAAPSEDTVPQTEEELADRMITKVKRIVDATDERLVTVEPIVDTLPAELGMVSGRIIKLWLENEQATKLTVTEPDDSGQMTGLSTFYFAGPDLFYASQPFAHFIFIGGKLEYWTDETWQVNPVSKDILDAREGYLYDEANKYMSWFFGN
ncbi:hypothetical protein [Phaeodactylibacter sp.]|uniref:hypothetical protein n=1 Tax=Phaeodactylibacter sp. TaxID=1940289 RepID=UPI0025EDF0D5|nr:hypothetical protein [Phaeodactylibacter sp.]MCI4650244.1 hypothetical protein [Phaeodactylibacter sp.]MCI5091408.1 hypothetical protein [Phaeodactylibacter sp.]